MNIKNKRHSTASEYCVNIVFFEFLTEHHSNRNNYSFTTTSFRQLYMLDCRLFRDRPYRLKPIETDKMIITSAAEQPRKAHPDQVANTIATILVGKLTDFGCKRADVDVTISDGHVNAEGNIRFDGWRPEVDYEGILFMTASDVLKSAGYTGEWLGFDPSSISPSTRIREQSDEIYNAQRDGYKYGDSRPIWGYYTRKTGSGLPLSTELIGNVIYYIDNAFMNGELPIGPDGKAQLTVDGHKISKITLAVQEESGTSHDEIVIQVDRYLREILGDHINSGTKVNINTSGSFRHGGPAYDKGQSNTKTGVYGQSFPPLGGGPYGKDITKAEIVLPIQARLIAEQLLEEYQDAEECIVLLDASIGESRPDIWVYFDNAALPDTDAARIAKKELDDILNPRKVIEKYLDKPEIYSLLAEHGLLGGALGEKYRPPFKI